MLEKGKFYRFPAPFVGAGVIKRHSSTTEDRVIRGMEFHGGYLESVTDSAYEFAVMIGRTKYQFTISKSTLKQKEIVETEPPSQE